MGMEEVEPGAHGQGDEPDALGARLGALLRRERARGFTALAGTRIEIAAPVRQPLLDRLVAEAAARAHGTDIRVDLLQGARLGVSVAHRVFGLPARASTMLTIDPVVDLERRRIVLRHDDSFLLRTIRAVVGPLGLLPPGIAFHPGAILVDLDAIAARGGWTDVLSWLRRLEIHGPADGLLVLDAELEVHATEGAAGPPPRAAGSVPLKLTPRDLLAGMAGARARAEIHVSEALVNDAIREVRATDLSRRRATTGSGAEGWPSWVRELSVRFDRATLIISAEVEAPERQDAALVEPKD
jgi:hypothetical protein